MGKRKGEASSERSAQEEAKSTAEGDLKETEGALSSDQSYLAELQASCEAKGKEWEVRQKEAQEEMGAIAKVKEILQQRVAGTDDARSQATELLRGLQKENLSFLLAQVVASAQSDPFGKVKMLIESLID